MATSELMPAKKNWRDLVEEDANGCWIWQGALGHHGRPQLGGRKIHRVIYGELIGPPAPVLHHVCRNILCVNPAHLKGYSSNAEHVRAEHDEGRFPKGHKPWQTGLRISPYPFTVEPSGRVRSVVDVTCIRCGKTVQRRRDRAGKFCGIHCALANARDVRQQKRRERDAR